MFPDGNAYSKAPRGFMEWVGRPSWIDRSTKFICDDSLQPDQLIGIDLSAYSKWADKPAAMASGFGMGMVKLAELQRDVNWGKPAESFASYCDNYLKRMEQLTSYATAFSSDLSAPSTMTGTAIAARNRRPTLTVLDDIDEDD